MLKNIKTLSLMDKDKAEKAGTRPLGDSYAFRWRNISYIKTAAATETFSD